MGRFNDIPRKGVSGFDRGLKCSASGVVECFVQQEDLGGVEAQLAKLPGNLLERVRPQTASDEGANMLGTQLHLNRTPGVKRERDESHCPQSMADGAALAIG